MIKALTRESIENKRNLDYYFENEDDISIEKEVCLDEKIQ